MMSDPCGSSLLLALPDDILAIVTRSLSPKDVCNLCLCCRNLSALAANEKVWFTQCDILGVIPSKDLVEWRKGISSYRFLCRFLVSVQPLIGIWVHQNPELGNVVYVMPGFISIVACRIIPQELGPLGIKDGPILWAPVFEILSDFDGSAALFLHGRDREDDFLYPGSIKAVDRACNVLLLEVESREKRSDDILMDNNSYAHHLDKAVSTRVSCPDRMIMKSQSVIGQNMPKVAFSRLAFGDRRKLLETVTSQVRFQVPNLASGQLFPCLKDDDNFQQDLVRLHERRSLLMQMYKLRRDCDDHKGCPQLPTDSSQLEMSEIRTSLDDLRVFRSSLGVDDGWTESTKRKNLSGYFKDGLKKILGKSSSTNYSREHLRHNISSSETKHAQLHEFLQSGDTIGLALYASTVKLSCYRAWPNMHDSRFALYKLPKRESKPAQEFSGLWGGTFGWPPGMPSEDKPGKALYLLFLSYEESQGQRLLIGTKILEGTQYVLHPNGSAMFIVNVNEPAFDAFPWDADVKHSFLGEGIANGYGFRYPGSKPGALFVLCDEILAFIWKESGTVLTLQRLDLQELLKKGERVPALPPTANFAYLTKSYSNVFTGFSNTSNSVSTKAESCTG